MNPCHTTIIDESQTIASTLSMTILGGTDTISFNKITDSATDTYGEDKCGTKSYELVMNDTEPTFLALTDNSDGTFSIALTPVLNDPIGTHTITLVFKLDEYATSHGRTINETFSVTIGACVVTSFDTTAITESDYTVNTGDKDIAFVGFTQTPGCEYTVTYTAFDTTATEFSLDGSQFITLEESKFVVNTSDPDDVDTYEIKLVGTLNDAAVTSSEVSFT